MIRKLTTGAALSTVALSLVAGAVALGQSLTPDTRLLASCWAFALLLVLSIGFVGRGAWRGIPARLRARVRSNAAAVAECLILAAFVVAVLLALLAGLRSIS